jgi:phosphonate transport system substrate-binding protein
MRRSFTVVAIAASLVTVLAGCGTSPGDPGVSAAEGGGQVLTISAIPDQDPDKLQRLYATVSDYLSDELGVEVRYVPVTDYAASVTAFRRGDLQMVFFGGLTGVQARVQVPDAIPIAQRDIDAEFRSVFVARTDSDLEPVQDVAGLRSLAGHSFTFGSESSTSGRLMPQYFMSEAGVALDDLTGQAGFSGSHDGTAKLVEAGTYDAGALNAAVWDDRVRDGTVNTTKVREIFRTPAYHDYHWVVRPDVDQRFGPGFTERLRDVLLAIDASDEQQRQILELFQAERFISTEAANYERIETVARSVGLLR